MPVVIELSTSEDVNQEDGQVPLLSQLQTWVNHASLDKAEVVTSIQILGKDEMQKLNHEYRGKDKATNVLSFPMQLPEHVEINLLGDLVLCADVINQEAEQQNKTREAHWAHMVVHGMLHLQGYNHENGTDADEMEALEKTILNELGFANPYKINS